MKPAQASVTTAFLFIGVMVLARNDAFQALKNWAQTPPKRTGP